jgi:hypothetical protein
MKCLDTSSRRTMLIVMLLVCLSGFGGSDPAHAESAEAFKFNRTVDHGYTFELAAFKAADPYRLPAPGAQPADATLGALDNTARADLYTLTRLAVEKLEFLAGIRILWDQAEKKFDRVALKLKLKGDISLGAGEPPAADTESPAPPLREYAAATRSDGSHPRLSLRALLIPDKIRWHFGLDANQHVFFGELKWGRFIALQSDIGNLQEVKMVFHYDF